MLITVDLAGVIEYLLDWDTAVADDDIVVIGLSRVAYLSSKDPAHAFLPAAVWHDAAYTSGASIQQEWPRWKVDQEFLKKMLDISAGDYDLEKEALTLYLVVRKYGSKVWEGAEC